jgi:hypothetical protein
VVLSFALVISFACNTTLFMLGTDRTVDLYKLTQGLGLT